jgi:chromosome partitioning protein
VGVIGMRVDVRTRAAEQLQRFVEGVGLPVLGVLRDTQNYVQLAAHGLTLWDVAPSRVARDREQWQPIMQWLANGQSSGPARETPREPTPEHVPADAQR